MHRIILSFILCFPLLAESASESPCLIRANACFHQCCPNGTNLTNDLVDHALYVLSSNRTTKFADWVAYTVEAKNLDGPYGTTRNWHKDPNLLEQYTLSPDDYTGAYELYNYDRGHQAPLADFSNHKDWEQLNYLSNITPQQATLNRRAWKVLEQAERTLVKKWGYVVLHVVTGPYFDNSSMPLLPYSHLEHVVPNGYWKLIIAENNEKKVGVLTFKFSQYEEGSNYCNNLVELETIQELTRFNILPNIRNEAIDNGVKDKLLMDLQCNVNASLTHPLS